MTSNATKRVRRKVLRQPISIESGKAVNTILAAVMGQVTQSPSVKIALASFIEGRRLKGEWRLRFTGAELVPVDDIHEGAATPD